MKIISGEKKNRNFYMPFGIRPTQNLTRKAIYDLVGHDLSGWEVLDLFAGSGAVGLEALSQGASRVVFVEVNAKCFEVIEENVALLGFKEQGMPSKRVELLNADAFMAVKQLSRSSKKFDLVFLDPPYGLGLVKKMLKTLSSYDIFKPNSFLIIEHGKREDLPEVEGRFSLITHRKYGTSFLAVYQPIREFSPSDTKVVAAEDNSLIKELENE